MSNKKSKPRIALFGMGTFDKGLVGVPVIIELFGRLTADFDVVFYGFLPTDYVGEAPITIRQPASWRLPGRIKYFLVAVRCIYDHLRNPFSLFYAISVYPAGKWALVLRKILNRPVVTHLIATEAIALPEWSLGNLTIPWLRVIALKVCKKTDVLITVSEYQRKLIEKCLPFKREIKTLPLRVNTNKFNYIKRSITMPVRFIHIAFYGPIKDQHTMFIAFSKVVAVVDCHLTVLGGGFDIPDVQKLLSDLGITDKVTFVGYVPNAALPQYLNDAQILLHSSRFEAEPIVIQEAMASGVAVCGSNVGTLADIGDGYAVMFNPGNADQMAENILELVNNPQRYEDITARAFQWIQTYDAAWCYANYRSLLKNTIAESEKYHV